MSWDSSPPPGSDRESADRAMATWPDPPRKICIAGNIGAGKTTLSKSLAAHLNFTVCEEPSGENPYLVDFYEDKSLSFKCQIAFLAARFANNKTVMRDLEASGGVGGVVQDRGPYEDVIFARMLYESGDMDKRDYVTYLRLFDTLVTNLGDDVPDVVLFLDVGVNELSRRVKKRGRDCEKGESGVTRGYLGQLAQQYERFVGDMAQRTPVYRVDWNTFRETSGLWGAVLEQYDAKPGLKTLEW